MKLMQGGAFLILFLGLSARGQILTNFFTGNVNLAAGDISDFFVPGTTNPLPGVCVMLDVDTALPGAPGSMPEPSDGLNESPGSAGGTKDGFIHPSGFNQRRIMSAYNPNAFGGTVYVGIDLPGGTGSAINRRFFNDEYGAVRAQGQVTPFDADGNGHPDGLGLDTGGRVLPGCPSGLNDLDIWSCMNQSFGATDDPRDNSRGLDFAIREFYTALVNFGDFTGVAVDFEVTHRTLPGQADLRITQGPGNTFGVLVSSDTGGTGVPQGFDVIFAITNVNQNVDPQSRLFQYVGVHSGSNRDGSGQGEDFNQLQCLYAPPDALTVTIVCPPTNTPPGMVLTVTGEVCNPGAQTLTDVMVTNAMTGSEGLLVLGPITLGPGECRSYVSSVVVPPNQDGCAMAGVVTAQANRASGSAMSATASADCPSRPGQASILVETFCPATPTAPGESLVFTGWICNSGDVTLHNILVTNTAPGIITNMVAGPFNLGPGECVGYTGSYVIPANSVACEATHTVNAVATTACGGELITGSDTRVCPILGGVDCPPRCAAPSAYWIENVDSWPAAYSSAQTINTVFTRASRTVGAKTLLDALRETTTGTAANRRLLREAVAAVLNAANPSMTFPFTVNEVVATTDAALLNGGTKALTNAAALLQQANETENCPPCLAVTTQVGNLLPGDEVGPLGESATGYSGLVDPAFGYSVTISNCGSVALSSLVAMDSELGDLSTNLFAEINGSLGPRRAVTKYFKASWWNTTTNLLTVKGRSEGPAAREIMAQDSSVAQVQAAAISCHALITSASDQDGSPADDHVELPANGSSHRVRIRVVVCNSSPIALKAVTINPGQLNCKTVGPFRVAAGKCVTNELCVQTINCSTAPLPMLFTVTGTLDAARGAGVSDGTGQRIQVSCQTAGLVECLAAGTSSGSGSSSSGSIGVPAPVVLPPTLVGVAVTNPANAEVQPANTRTCPASSDEWVRASDWSGYVHDQTVLSVFSEIARYGTAANQPLLKAVRGRVGLGKVRGLLEHGTAALLNAAALGNKYPFTKRDIVEAVNVALRNGKAEALTDLTNLLISANRDPACDATVGN